MLAVGILLLCSSAAGADTSTKKQDQSAVISSPFPSYKSYRKMAHLTDDSFSRCTVGDSLTIRWSIDELGDGPFLKTGSTIDVGLVSFRNVKFEEAVGRGWRFSFVAGDTAIGQGINKLVTMMKEGSGFIAFMPAFLARGVSATWDSLPGDSTVYMKITVLSVR